VHSPILGIFTRFDSQWKAVLGESINYIYELPRIFNLIAFIEIVQTVISLIIIKTELKDYLTTERKWFFTCMIIIPPTLFAIYLVTSSIFNLALFTSLQLSRTFVVWKIILPILFSFYAFNKIKNQPANVICNFLLFGVLISLVFFKLASMIFLPGLFLLLIKEHSGNFNFSVLNSLKERISNLMVISVSCILALLFLFESTKIVGLFIATAKSLSIIILPWFLAFFTKGLYDNRFEAKEYHINKIFLAISALCFTIFFIKPMCSRFLLLIFQHICVYFVIKMSTIQVLT